MEQGFVEFLLNQSGAMGLAALCLYFLNKLQQDSTRREQENSKNLALLNQQLFTILADTLKTLTMLQGEIREIRNAVENRHRPDESAFR